MASAALKEMTKTELECCRRTLLEKAEEIRIAMQTSRAGRALFGEPTSNMEDLPVQSHEEWIFLNRNSIDTMLLREINDSLARIDEGSYGICSECDEPISKKRLEAIPWARYCISCQEELAAQQEERAAKQESRR